MKHWIATMLMIGLASTALALDKAELDRRAQKVVAKFEAMQAKTDKQVPSDVLQKAKGIILLDRTKAGFIFAYQGGAGLALVKDKSGKWSPWAFMKADEASLGFQIGGQQSFLAIVLMDEKTAKSLIADAAFELGGEARGTAGKASTGAEGKVEDIERSVRIYDERSGLFGGAAIKGGAISPDHDANRVYYGSAVTMQDILFDQKVKPADAATALAKKLDSYSKSSK
jgi:SH3 domain-containing YSC84-like protein 1